MASRSAVVRGAKATAPSVTPKLRYKFPELTRILTSDVLATPVEASDTRSITNCLGEAASASALKFKTQFVFEDKKSWPSDWVSSTADSLSWCGD